MLYFGFNGDIGGDCSRANLVCYFLEPIGIQVCDDDLFSAFIGESSGHGSSDTTGAAGNYDDFVFNFHNFLWVCCKGCKSDTSPVCCPASVNWI